MNEAPQGIWTAKNIAKLLQLEERDLAKLTRTGIIPRGPGGYSVVTAVQAYVTHLRKQSEERAEDVYSTQKLADHVGVTPQRINQYVRLGMPKHGRNEFNPDQCCRWIQDYEKLQWEQKHHNTEKEQWDARIAQLDFERKHDDLMVRRKQLIPEHEIKPVLERTIAGFKVTMQGLGRKEAPQIAAAIAKQLALTVDQTQGLIPLISEAIEDPVRERLNTLASTLIRVGDIRRPAGVGRLDGQPGPSRKKANTKPVGRRQPADKSGSEPDGIRPMEDQPGKVPRAPDEPAD